MFFDCHHICNAIEALVITRYVSAVPSPRLGGSSLLILAQGFVCLECTLDGSFDDTDVTEDTWLAFGPPCKDITEPDILILFLLWPIQPHTGRLPRRVQFSTCNHHCQNRRLRVVYTIRSGVDRVRLVGWWTYQPRRQGVLPYYRTSWSQHVLEQPNGETYNQSIRNSAESRR